MSVFPTHDEAYDAVYAQEAAMIDAGELLAEALERSGMNRSQLAKKLGISRAEITARLSGDRNITVRKLAATLQALGSRLELQSVRNDAADGADDAVLLTYAARAPSRSRPPHFAWSGDTHSRPAVGDYRKVMTK